MRKRSRCKLSATSRRVLSIALVFSNGWRLLSDVFWFDEAVEMGGVHVVKVVFQHSCSQCLDEAVCRKQRDSGR